MSTETRQKVTEQRSDHDHMPTLLLPQGEGRYVGLLQTFASPKELGAVAFDTELAAWC